MHCYKMVIAYDGTSYEGWQVQVHSNTVAGTILKTFQRTFKQMPSLLGASRTDSGVHALGQVARLTLASYLPPQAIMRGLNNALPASIAIRSVEYDALFHPHKKVKEKHYLYTFFLKRPLPFIARYGWYPFLYVPTFSYEKYKAVLPFFVGTHHFGAFSKVAPGKDPIRTVTHMSSQYFARYGAVITHIKGKGFLQYQIRRMIGAAVSIASNPVLSPDYTHFLLTNPEQQPLCLGRADASGLCLKRIYYDT